MSDHTFETRDSLDAALADFVAKQLTHAIAERGKASLIVSGGSTPKGFFSILANKPVEWSKVTVMAADDRWVALSDSASNETMIRELLLKGKAAEASLLSLVPAYPDRDANLKKVLESLRDFSTFDVVILGMGLDAHTASLFPCSEQLQEGLTTNADALMTEPTTAPHARVTLSRARLANTRVGLVHLTGSEKLDVFDAARASGDVFKTPIAAFLTGETPFSLWYAP